MMMLVIMGIFWKWTIAGFVLFILQDLYQLRVQLLKEKSYRNVYAEYIEVKKKHNL